MKKIIAIIGFVVVMASFTSCDKLEGSAKTKADIIDADWKLEQIKLAEDDTFLQEFLDLITIVPIYYDFKEGGVYESYAKFLGQKTDASEGTWELADDGKTITVDDVIFDLDVATTKNLEFSASMAEASGLLGYSSEDYDENRLSYVFIAD